ncbi:MAG TPA: AAA family ATPase [Chthoniobacterales bacterium]|nr:AAA family ATPase [Chthoniobacterales bacterium]
MAILQGLPGTGKTSYLRHLMCELRRSHRCYFFPITSYPLLTSPACVDFWLGEHERYKDFEKIVVIEDAESLLLTRGPDNQEVLSNLLNLADGFLGDCLKLQVICTVNTPTAKLDPAVIRPGRLIASREFRRLSPLEAERIAERRGIKLEPQESYSLAEIYNRNNSRKRKSAGHRRIGFATQ